MSCSPRSRPTRTDRRRAAASNEGAWVRSTEARTKAVEAEARKALAEGRRAEGVTRLRDALGNQLVSELLVKTIARRGYVLAVGKDAIRMV